MEKTCENCKNQECRVYVQPCLRCIIRLAKDYTDYWEPKEENSEPSTLNP